MTDKEVQVVQWQEQALAEFRPLPERLRDLAAQAGAFVLSDFQDKERAAVAHAKRIELRDARIELQDIGKSLRAGALSFQKRVIEKEKELVAMVEGEEKRLKELEDEAERISEREKRRARIPERQNRLKTIGVEVADDALLDLDSEQFEAFYNKCVADNNERERVRLEKEAAERRAAEDAARAEETRKLAAEREAIEIEKRKVAEEAAKVEAAKAAQEAAVIAKAEAEAAAKAEAERKEAEAKAEAARIETEKVAEAARLAKRVEWQKFCASHGYSEATKGEFVIKETQTGFDLYKRVGSFTK